MVGSPVVGSPRTQRLTSELLATVSKLREIAAEVASAELFSSPSRLVPNVAGMTRTRALLTSANQALDRAMDHAGRCAVNTPPSSPAGPPASSTSHYFQPQTSTPPRTNFQAALLTSLSHSASPSSHLVPQLSSHYHPHTPIAPPSIQLQYHTSTGAYIASRSNNFASSTLQTSALATPNASFSLSKLPMSAQPRSSAPLLPNQAYRMSNQSNLASRYTPSPMRPTSYMNRPSYLNDRQSLSFKHSSSFVVPSLSTPEHTYSSPPRVSQCNAANVDYSSSHALKQRTQSPHSFLPKHHSLNSQTPTLVAPLPIHASPCMLIRRKMMEMDSLLQGLGCPPL